MLRTKPATSKASQARAKAEQRSQQRLAERERVSGEIRTPAEITAKRARRADRPHQPAHAPSKRSPVSASALVPERTFSARTIVLTIVALVVISFMVPTVHSYLQQQSEINELSEQIRAEERTQAELHTELNRWEDPEFVQQQARERLQLVQPGERRYQVVGDIESVDLANGPAEAADAETSWTEQLWGSVVEASHQDAE